MSGSVEPMLPATILISQFGLTPVVSVADTSINAQPVGIPPFPLSTNPGETWWLTAANGVLAWVQQPDAPSNAIFTLEDAQGFFLLEDGEGALLMEV